MHPWNISTSEAKKIQEKLSGKLIISGAPHKINYIAAADIAYINNTGRAVCGIAIFSYPGLEFLKITCRAQQVYYMMIITNLQE